MSAPAAASCMVVLNQQREQTVQHHEQCDRVKIVPCKASSSQCTIVENGKVVVKSLPVALLDSSMNHAGTGTSQSFR